MKKEKVIKDAPKNTFKTAKRLFKQLSNQKIKLIFVIISVMISTILYVYTPFYSVKVMDALYLTIMDCIKNGNIFMITWNPLGKELVIITVLYLFASIFYYLQTFLMSSVAEKLTLTLREQISDKMHKLPLKFYDNNKPGEILSRVTNDLDKVSETLQTGLLRLIVAIGSIIGSLAFMIYFSPVLTLIFVGFAFVSILLTKNVARKNLILSSDRQEKVSILTGLAEEHFTGRNVIKAYNNQQESITILNNAIENLAKANRKTDFLTNFVNPVIRLISRLSQAFILLLSCSWMIKGTMSFGVVQAYFQYIGICSEPLTEASYMINSLQSAFASAERTFEFLDEKEEIEDIKNPQVIEKANGIVSFENVSFGYSKDKILMKNINFTANKGQKIAIVGATGAGKTTLINLLMRFYEVDDGKIKIDSIQTTNLTKKNLRENFGMVLQDTWLFKGTIAQNISYGKQNATMDEIENAAKMAQIDHFIKTMPQGYETILDNDAANISIGQRQLLTIARVFLKDPPILILDEATSSVDTRTEVQIGIAMESLMKGRTSFVIAHRLSTIRDADTILFMENGNIIEQGNHETLLKKGGAYAALYNSQFE